MADKWEWRAELVNAHLTQSAVGEFLGLTKSQMEQLVKKMVIGRGLTASPLDQKRWNQALDYIKLQQNKIEQEA